MEHRQQQRLMIELSIRVPVRSVQWPWERRCLAPRCHYCHRFGQVRAVKAHPTPMCARLRGERLLVCFLALHTARMLVYATALFLSPVS